jgi:hypothetical protein
MAIEAMPHSAISDWRIKGVDLLTPNDTKSLFISIQNFTKVYFHNYSCKYFTNSETVF